MGLFNRRSRAEALEEEGKKARFDYDCSKSQSVIIELQQKLEALASFAAKHNYDIAVRVAEDLCTNMIITLGNAELPLACLKVVQNDILSVIRRLDSSFNSNPVQGFFNMALHWKG